MYLICLCAENNEGNTPLMIAEEKNFDDCIELVSDEKEGERRR